MTFKHVQWAAASLGIAAIVAALLCKVLTNSTALTITELGAICFLGLLFVLASNVDGIRSITVGKEGFRVDLDRLQKTVSENDQAITELVLLSMGKDAYINLRKLATGSYGRFEKEPHMGLETELYHLRNLGYVELKEGTAHSIHEIPKEGPELSTYIRVTEEGQKYIRLRDKYQERRGE